MAWWYFIIIILLKVIFGFVDGTGKPCPAQMKSISQVNADQRRTLKAMAFPAVDTVRPTIYRPNTT